MTLELRLAAAERLSPTLKRLVLAAADGGALPVAAAGAHLTLTLAGADGRVLRNAYSLVAGHHVPGEPRSDAYSLVVRRTGGARGGSAHVHDRLRQGDLVEAGMPHNLFPLAMCARRHLMVGGGIGVTPLLSFLPVLRAAGAAFELHQVAARDEAAVFARLLGAEAGGGEGVHVHAGRGGLDLDVVLARQPLGTHLYTCGPAALMDRVAARAAAAGWPAASVHREDFDAAALGGEPFAVRLAGSDRRIAVGADETMLEALERAGLDPPSLCRGGVCGECLARLVGGEADHRDHFLSDEEKASQTLVMPCVSRARGAELMLDLTGERP